MNYDLRCTLSISFSPARRSFIILILRFCSEENKNQNYQTNTEIITIISLTLMILPFYFRQPIYRLPIYWPVLVYWNRRWCYHHKKVTNLNFQFISSECYDIMFEIGRYLQEAMLGRLRQLYELLYCPLLQHPPSKMHKKTWKLLILCTCRTCQCVSLIF